MTNAILFYIIELQSRDSGTISKKKEITVKVNGFDAGAKISLTDESHFFDTVEADIQELTLEANAIALIEA